MNHVAYYFQYIFSSDFLWIKSFTLFLVLIFSLPIIINVILNVRRWTTVQWMQMIRQIKPWDWVDRKMCEKFVLNLVQVTAGHLIYWLSQNKITYRLSFTHCNLANDSVFKSTKVSELYFIFEVRIEILVWEPSVSPSTLPTDVPSSNPTEIGKH